MPRQKKSTCDAIRSQVWAAAGVSIITPSGNSTIIRLAPQIKLTSDFREHFARGIQIINRRHEGKKNAHRSAGRCSVKCAKLLLENVLVLKTEPQTPGAEIQIHSLPGLLINSDVDRTECDRCTLGSFQDVRIVLQQRVFVRLLSFTEEIELGSIQADRFAAIRTDRFYFSTEIDIRAERNTNAIFGKTWARCRARTVSSDAFSRRGRDSDTPPASLPMATRSPVRDYHRRSGDRRMKHATDRMRPLQPESRATWP